MEYCPRKIHLPDNMTVSAPYTVIPTDIDTNGHVNNARYIELAWSRLPENLIRSDHIWRIRAEYKKAAMLQDKIHPQTAVLPLSFPEHVPLEGFSDKCFDTTLNTGSEHIIHLAANDSFSGTAPSFASIAFSTKEA